MILVFIILGIIIFLCAITFLFSLSYLQINLKQFHIWTTKSSLKVEFILDFAICFLNKIKIFHVAVDHEKINQLISSGKIDIQKLKENKPVNKDLLNSLKMANLKIERFHIEGYFSTFNAVLSSSIYAFIYAVIPIILAPKMKGTYTNHIKYLEMNENFVNIYFNCIISTKMVNIMNMVYDLKKKGDKEENGRKSSNRRSYAHSYE